MKIEPVNKRVLLKKVEHEAKKGSLILPSSPGYTDLFEIVSLDNVDSFFEVGEKVFLDIYPREIKNESETLYVVKEENIIATATL